jgi:transposase
MYGMEELRTNAKQLTQKEQYTLRKSIIRLLNQGLKPNEIMTVLDVSRSHVFAVKKIYTEKGVDGIKPGKRGRRHGAKRILTPQQEQDIQKAIIDRHPEQLKLPGCMWTRENIRDLIKRWYKIDILPSTMGYYLARWGFSVQRPVKRAYKQDTQKIADWVEEKFPGIKQRAEEEDAEIFFGDETGIQNTANYARGYAPKGQTPVVQIEAKKMKINMLSAVSSRGKLRFMLYKDNMNGDKLTDFLGRLIKDTEKKVFLVLDNLRVHHSKMVASWLEGHKDGIELFYLPPYAPEYNPGEYLNSDLKRGVGCRSMPRTENELEHNIRSHMKSVQLNPAKIQSFFQSPTTSYAA